MTRSAAALAAALLALSSLPATAHAQSLTDWPSYQGRLMDNGEPVNGLWNFQIAYYDSETGGSSTYGQVNNDILVTDGLFTIPLNAYSLLTNAHTEIWLEIQVWPTDFSSPPATLSPRQPVSPAAKALRADFAYTSATGLSDAYDNDNVILGAPASPVTILGTDLIAGQSLQVGQPNGPFSTLNVYSQFSPDIIAQIGPDSTDGGFIRAFQVPGSIHAASIETDSQGGGFLSIARDSLGNSGFQVDGNFSGLDATNVSIYNSSGFVHTQFNASIPNGDTAAVLPYQSVSEFEILNESGVVAARRNAANTVLSTAASAVLTRTITPPTDGFVVMTGTAEVNASHTTGTTTTITVGLGIGSNAYLNSIEHGHQIPSTAPTGTYIVILPAHDVLTVSGSTPREVRLLAQVNGGTGRIVDSSLSAVYIPTAYGTTAGSVLHDPTRPESAPSLGVLRPEVHAAELAAEEEWSQADMLKRMARLEARIQVQQTELQELRSDND